MSHALSHEESLHTQEHRESCPQLGKPTVAKLMAENNELRTTVDGESRVREMPPVV